MDVGRLTCTLHRKKYAFIEEIHYDTETSCIREPFDPRSWKKQHSIFTFLHHRKHNSLYYKDQTFNAV
jgi:hypothetical protein